MGGNLYYLLLVHVYRGVVCVGGEVKSGSRGEWSLLLLLKGGCTTHSCYKPVEAIALTQLNGVGAVLWLWTGGG